MRSPKCSYPMKSLVWTLVMAVTCMAVARPRAEAMLVPSSAVRSEETTTHTSDLQTIQTSLESKAIRAKLHALGLSDEEIQSRLSRLSDGQVHQLASQIRAVNPAGDGGGFVIGILIIAVLVLLIIYLVKRV